MIPKKIHYCWFGGNPLSDKELKCIESWKKLCPDYEIIRWDETNYDVHKNKFISQAYIQKKWAFVTDYARLDIVYHNGGIYLDTDVEIIKSFDPLLENKAFMGFEKKRVIATGLGFGAEQYHSAVKDLMDSYNDLEFLDEYGLIKSSKFINCPIINTELLKSKGAVMDDSLQIVDGITLYPTEYFCPLHSTSGEMNITKNTYSIHWYNMSWFDSLSKFWRRTEQKLSKPFGNKIAHKIVRVLNLPDRAVRKLKKIITKKYKEFICCRQ